MSKKLLACLFFNLTINGFYNVKISMNDIIQDNIKTSVPFRCLMAKNTIHNLVNAEKNYDNSEYKQLSISLIMAACSAITALTYPADNNYNYHKQILTQKKSLILSAISVISCFDASTKPLFCLHECPIYFLISAVPLYHSGVYFGLNINK